MVVKFHFMKFDGNITESWQEDKLNREKFSTADTLGRLSLFLQILGEGLGARLKVVAVAMMVKSLGRRKSFLQFNHQWRLQNPPYFGRGSMDK